MVHSCFQCIALQGLKWSKRYFIIIDSYFPLLGPGLQYLLFWLLKGLRSTNKPLSLLAAASRTHKSLPDEKHSQYRLYLVGFCLLDLSPNTFFSDVRSLNLLYLGPALKKLSLMEEIVYLPGLLSQIYILEPPFHYTQIY